MSLAAAAVCPCPPLLVPEVAAGAAPEMDDCRAACDRAVGRLVQMESDLLVVVGGGSGEQLHGAGAWGSLAGVGCPEVVAALDGPAAGPATLPLALTIGAWLLARSGCHGLRIGLEVPADCGRDRCRRLGADLARSAAQVGLLVMGDGSARRNERAPGHLDQAAGAADSRVVAALADPDPDALLQIAEPDARALMVAGRPAWQVLAGAGLAGGPSLAASLLYDDAPYGVGYFVASWWTRRA